MEAEEQLLGLFAKNFSSAAEAEKGLAFLKKLFQKNPETESAYAGHNARVAKSALDSGMGRNTVIAALLHNAIRLGVQKPEIEKEFGKATADIIEQQDLLERALEKNQPGESAEESKKKLMAIVSTSPAAAIVQLSEALDKLRNLEAVKESEREKFVSEAKEVYSPLAQKLGMYPISSEMNDLLFKIEQPAEHNRISNEINDSVQRLGSEMGNAKETLASALKAANMNAEVVGRVKTPNSTFLKMKKKGCDIVGIYDLVALRVITDSIKECYEALGIVHTLWRPVLGEFDDYIAKPKENGYKSLHTCVYLNEAEPIEVQIRTREMHDFAEHGIASHWRYKGDKADSRHDRKIEWVKQILTWEKSSGANSETGVLGNEVFAMTPKGEVIELPIGATVLDFAYAIHSDIGNKCQSARINDNPAPLSAEIKSCDVVEIITNHKQFPKRGWLAIAKSSKARQKIKARLNISIARKEGKGGIAKKQGDAARDIAALGDRTRLAKCCSPIPGDKIIGFKTTKRKVSIHRADCAEANKLKMKKINVSWEGGRNEFHSEIVVHAADRPSILRELLDTIASEKIQVRSTNAKAVDNKSIVCRFGVMVRSAQQLEKAIRKISSLKGVSKAGRERKMGN